MKFAIDLGNKKIVDILPDSATNENKFLLNNGYKLFEAEEVGAVISYLDDEDTTPIFRDLTSEELAPYLLDKENTEYEAQVSLLTTGVPKDEIATWTKQESEARAYLNDNTVATPLIDSIANARGVEKEYLVNKIIEKADAYAVAIGNLTGLRQAKEKEILEGE